MGALTRVPSVSLSGAEDSTARSDGPLVLTATATDAAGNEATTAVTVTVDNTAPVKTVVTPTNGEIVSGSIDITAIVVEENLDLIEIRVDGASQGTSTVSPFTVAFDTTARLDGSMEVTVVARDLAGNEDACTVEVTVDNISVVLHPEPLNLKSKGKNRSVTAILEGENVDLLLPVESSALALCIPGGNSVPVTTGFAGDDATADSDGDGTPELLVKFDRRALIASIRAGISTGQIQPNSTLLLTIKADGFVLGTETIRIRGN